MEPPVRKQQLAPPMPSAGHNPRGKAPNARTSAKGEIASKISKRTWSIKLSLDEEIRQRRYMAENIVTRLKRADNASQWVYISVAENTKCRVCTRVMRGGDAFRLTGTPQVIVCEDCVELSTMPDSETPGLFDTVIRDSIEFNRLVFSASRQSRLQ